MVPSLNLFFWVLFDYLVFLVFGCVSIIHVVMEQIFGMAEKEMEYRVELFNK